MASKKRGLNEGSALFFLFKPFKWFFTYLILFCSFVAIATCSLVYFCTKSDLLSIAKHYSITKISQAAIEHQIGHFFYKILHWVVFDLPGIKNLLFSNAPSSDLNGQVQSALIRNYDQILKFDLTLQIVSMRMGILLTYSCTILLILVALATFDGLMSRKIRTACLGRESSTMYHQAKFLRSGVLIFTCLLFFSWPSYLDPLWLIVFGAVFALFVWLQAKFYKKYV